MKKTLFALLTLTAICHAQTGAPVDATRDFVLTGNEAIGMLPPKVVCEYAPTDARWSPDGKYILLVRADPKITPGAIKQFLTGPGGTRPVTEKSILIVDVAKGTSQTIWKSEDPNVSIGEMSWLVDTPLAYFTLITQKVDPETKVPSEVIRVVSVHAQTGKMQAVAEGAPDEWVVIHLSPLRPMGLIQFMAFDPATRTSKGRFVPLDAAGRPGQAMAIADPAGRGQIGWTDDGARPLITAPVRDEQGKFKQKRFVMDFASGKTQEVVGVRAYDELPLKEPELYIDVTKTEAKTGDSVRSVDVSWLKSRTASKLQAAMIGTEVEAVISPTANAIMCTHQGIVTLRALVSVPRDAFEKALMAAEKAKAINDAKQCALGFIMLASDMDDVLPNSNGDWASMVQPYLKNDAAMSGFVYTFGGGNMAAIESPAETAIGYKPGPGGRAVAYADGHVRWIPDK